MPHSYSRYSTYKQCAAKHNYSYIVRLPRGAQHPAASRGDDIHQSVDNYMLGKTEMLHKDIHSKYGQWLWGIRNEFTCRPEHKFAYDVDWKPVPYTSKKARIRGKLDLNVYNDEEAGTYEWKTGRMYDDHADQRFLYGLVTLLLHEQFDQVDVQGVYFDQKDNPPPDIFERKNIDMMKHEWSSRLDRIDAEQVHAPNPSYLCSYCAFSRDNGGPCQF